MMVMVNLLSAPFYLITPLVGVIVSIVLIVLLSRKDYRGLANRLFILLLLSLGLNCAFRFVMRISPDTGHALFWEQIFFPFGYAIFVFYYHFTCVYTRAINRKLLIIAYVFLFVVAILSYTGYLISHMTLESYGYAPHFLPSIYIVSLGGIFFLVMALLNLIKAFRSTSAYLERTRLAYMVCAIVVFLLFGVLDFFPGLPPVGIIGNILFCLITAIAILKYHLLDINVVIRKGVAYFLMSAVVCVAYVAIIFSLTQLFEIQLMPILIYLILVTVLFLILRPLWSRVQRWVDRWFYQERYDFLKALEDFSLEVHSVRDASLLGASLVKLVSRALQSSEVFLLVSSGSGHYDLVSSAKENYLRLSLSRQSSLVRWLQSNKSILHRRDLSIIPQLQSLTADEVSELEEIRAELFVPITTKEQEVIGILILGQKLSQQPYSGEDERLLLTIASRVAVEMENARLYHDETMMRRELEKESERKTEFLHNVAHELKTPLTAIISSSELLGDAGQLSISASQRERLISSIARSAWSMNNRVAELLDLAKAEAGELQLQLQPLEIGSTIKEVASQLLVLFENKKQSLKLEIPEYLPQVRADKSRFEQILVNLLSNANKFSPTEGSITLRAKENKYDRKVVVEVEDSAPAVTEEEKRKLFNPYYRGDDKDRKERIPGLGLGLSISRRLVELHEGEIWVESKAGKGNIFAFSLPVLQHEAEETG